MSVEVMLPKLDFSMTEGTIAEWLVAEGGQAVEGQPLYVVEADKSSVEVEALASGTLSIVVASGETVEVGTVIGHIG